MEEKEYMTVEEAAEYIGMKRATLYNYMHDLDIKSKRFKRDRKAYIAQADVQKMKQYRESPWTLRKAEEDAA